MTDEQLMTDLQQGQIQAAGQLYERYKRNLVGYFYNNTSSLSTSEDLVQQTFEKLLRYKDNFNQTGSFRAWIYTVARNVMFDFFNEKNRNIASLDDRHSEIEGGINLLEKDDKTAYNHELLKKAFSGLSEEKRELISMVKLQGMAYSDAAEMYNTTEGNIKVKVFRIMKELKVIMKNYK